MCTLKSVQWSFQSSILEIKALCKFYMLVRALLIKIKNEKSLLVSFLPFQVILVELYLWHVPISLFLCGILLRHTLAVSSTTGRMG